MISKVPSDLEILGIYEILPPLLPDDGGDLMGVDTRGVGWGWGNDAFPRLTALRWQCLCENSNFFFFLIYVTVGKQPPEQAVPPLGTININMCSGPSAPASLCVNEA